MAFYVDPEKDTPEHYFEEGLSFIRDNEPEEANKMWKVSATRNHVSSIYNLALMNGSGIISPFSIDFAAECFYKAASLGHKQAQQSLFMLEAADRGGFGFDNLAAMAKPADITSSGDILTPLDSMHTVSACRFVKVLCDIFRSTEEVIAYELDCATASDEIYVHDFIKRTGVPQSLYSEGEYRLEQGSPADKITDGLNQLSISMSQKGSPPEVIAFQRCTILGYVILHSPWGYDSSQLRGMDKFFSHD